MGRSTEPSIANCHSSVNSGLLYGQHSAPAAGHTPDVSGEQLREIVRGYVESLIDRHADGNQSLFCRHTKIYQSDLNRALNKKKSRGITWDQLARIGTAGHGYPSIAAIFIELGDLIAAAEAREIVTQRREAGTDLGKVIQTKAKGSVSKEAARALREIQETQEKPPAPDRESPGDRSFPHTPTRRP